LHDDFSRKFDNLFVKERFNISDHLKDEKVDIGKNFKSEENFTHIFDEIMGVDAFMTAIEIDKETSFKRLPTAEEKKAFSNRLRTDIPARRICIL
jgi:hypothetical protein